MHCRAVQDVRSYPQGLFLVLGSFYVLFELQLRRDNKDESTGRLIQGVKQANQAAAIGVWFARVRPLFHASLKPIVALKAIGGV